MHLCPVSGGPVRRLADSPLSEAGNHRADRKMNFKFSPVLLAACLFTYAGTAAPTISSFDPIFGATNDALPITITGSGFYPGTVYVAFTVNGVEYAGTNYQATSTDGTQITARVRTGTPTGSGPIHVRVAGIDTWSAANFTVIGPGPFVTNFTPVIGGAGTIVTNFGVHFWNGATSKQVTNVSFNGVAGVIVQVVNDGEIHVQAPAGVTTGPLTLRSPLGFFNTISNIFPAATNFFVSPTSSGFSPAQGRQNTNVVITGSNLRYTTSVSFNGTSANFTPPTNNTTLQAVVPPNATTGKITVIAPAGSYTTSSNFVVQPTVYSFSPGFGPAGTSVTVLGANFNVSGLAVKFGGVPAAAPTGVTFGQLTAVVPNGATNAPITVTTVDGSNTSAQIFYLPASITGFTPTNSPAGTTVTINGINFIGATAVAFNGTPASSFSVTNNTIIGATVPGGVITGPISVTTPAGTTNSGTLLFYGAPAIYSFSPMHGLPGTRVMISGLNFLGATAVLFGGVQASFTVTNNTTIGAVVPAGAQTGPITVVAPGGSIPSSSSFTLDSSDVAVSLADSPDPVFAGSNLVYTVTVANSGPVAASNVRLTNTLPVSILLLSAATSQGTLSTNGNVIRGALGTINSGGSATVTLTVVPQVPGTITDTASAGSDIPDPVPSNNSAAIVTTVWPVPMLSIALLTNQVQVAWPAPLSNFTLQFRNSLGMTYFWSNVLIPPVLSGGSNIVVEASTNSSRFYRLKL